MLPTISFLMRQYSEAGFLAFLLTCHILDDQYLDTGIVDLTHSRVARQRHAPGIGAASGGEPGRLPVEWFTLPNLSPPCLRALPYSIPFRRRCRQFVLPGPRLPRPRRSSGGVAGNSQRNARARLISGRGKGDNAGRHSRDLTVISTTGPLRNSTDALVAGTVAPSQTLSNAGGGGEEHARFTSSSTRARAAVEKGARASTSLAATAQGADPSLRGRPGHRLSRPRGIGQCRSVQ